MQTLNIRNAEDRGRLAAQGYTWATVVPRGENKGQIRSKHRSHETAEKAARGLDRDLVEIREGGSY